MKVCIAWSVYDTYDEVLLGSEIARLQNDETHVFDSLYLISQGGYPEPPSASQRQYLNAHFMITFDENALTGTHLKFVKAARVMKGIQNAYEYALSMGCDYVVVTNADAWCLDLSRLRMLLEQDGVRRNAIAARVARVSGLDISYGSYAPHFDDHFLILNVPLCAEYGVFDSHDPKALGAIFALYGGIHYMLLALMDERVPPGAFHAYSYFADCVNQFGELGGWHVLPWQYQPSYSFLHANCADEPDLHVLRAELLRLRGLDKYPAVAAYCRTYPGTASDFGHREGYAYYRQSFAQRLRVRSDGVLRRLYHRYLRAFKYRRMNSIKRQTLPSHGDALFFHDLDRHVLPTGLATRPRVTGP